MQRVYTQGIAKQSQKSKRHLHTPHSGSKRAHTHKYTHTQTAFVLLQKKLSSSLSTFAPSEWKCHGPLRISSSTSSCCGSPSCLLSRLPSSSSSSRLDIMTRWDLFHFSSRWNYDYCCTSWSTTWQKLTQLTVTFIEWPSELRLPIEHLYKHICSSLWLR